MATTTQYLEQLQIDKQTLVDNLVAKGVDANNDETFTTLVPKVADIPSGGADEYFIDGTLSSGNVSAYLKTIPMIDTSNRSYFNTFFVDCVSLVDVPQIDTSKAVSVQAMFRGCTSLERIPSFNLKKVTNAATMFANCGNLVKIDELDFDIVSNTSYMFQYCKNLKSIPLFNTSNVTDMKSMFHMCNKLEYIPQFDTSHVTSMSGTFASCESLKTIPQIDTSNLIVAEGMFQYCRLLENIPFMDFSKVSNIPSMLYGCESLTELGGFKDLGKGYSTTSSANSYSYTLSLSSCKNLTHDSLMNVINNLYDIATAGVQTQKLELGTTNLAKLTAEEIAIATNKGWTVS